MIEHQRQPLPLRQALQGVLDQAVAHVGVDAGEHVVGQRELDLGLVVLAVLAPQLREHPPALAVAEDVVQGQVARDRLEPAARRGAGLQVLEVLVRLQEHFLGDVLGLPVVADEPGRGGENHILIGTHEACKGVEADWDPEVAWPLELSSFKPRTPSGAESYTLRAMSKQLVILLTAALALGGAAWPALQAASLAEIESAYADFNDAAGAIGLIESGLRDSHEGRTRSEWLRLQQDARKQVLAGLKGLADRDLAPADRRAVEIMRRSMADSEEQGSLAPVGKCEDAQRKDIEYAALREALYACFGALSNSLDFEGEKVTRVGAFDLLTRMDEPERRKKLFLAFVPLWQAINGKSERDSPYRRVVAMAAERGAHRRHRDRCRCEDGRRVDGRSRDAGWCRYWTRGARRAASTPSGAVGLPLSRRRDRARARRCDRARGDAADQRALLPRSRRAARARGT